MSDTLQFMELVKTIRAAQYKGTLESASQIFTWLRANHHGNFGFSWEETMDGVRNFVLNTPHGSYIVKSDDWIGIANGRIVAVDQYTLDMEYRDIDRKPLQDSKS